MTKELDTNHVLYHTAVSPMSHLRSVFKDKLQLLDSLLLEVCIRWSLIQPSNNLHFFRPNERPLQPNQKSTKSFHLLLFHPYPAHPKVTQHNLWPPILLWSSPNLVQQHGHPSLHSRQLSKTTKLIIAWFTSTRGVYQLKSDSIV